MGKLNVCQKWGIHNRDYLNICQKNSKTQAYEQHMGKNLRSRFNPPALLEDPKLFLKQVSITGQDSIYYLFA